MSGDGRHCLDGIQDEVEDHLLQLNPVSQDRPNFGRELGDQRNVVALYLGSRERDDVEDDLIDIQQFSAWRAFLGKRPDASDDFTGSFSILDNGFQGLPCLFQVGGCTTSQRIAASALATTPAIGWLTS